MGDIPGKFNFINNNDNNTPDVRVNFYAINDITRF